MSFSERVVSIYRGKVERGRLMFSKVWGMLNATRRSGVLDHETLEGTVYRHSRKEKSDCVRHSRTVWRRQPTDCVQHSRTVWRRFTAKSRTVTENPDCVALNQRQNPDCARPRPDCVAQQRDCAWGDNSVTTVRPQSPDCVPALSRC